MKLLTLENGKLQTYSAEQISFDRECDVLCIGVGSAGGYAAIAAAREGVRVIAVEKDANVGGMPVSGRVTFYYYGFPGGTFEKNDERGRTHRDVFAANPTHNQSDLIQMMLLDEMDRQGVSLLNRAVVTGVYFEGNVVVGARIYREGREENIRSTMLIDATSDGHVIRMCPVETYLGRDVDGKTVPFTVRTETLEATGKYRYDNGDSGYGNQYCVADFSKKVLTAHASKHSVPDMGRRLVAVAPVCGVREGVRYLGEETLRYSDIILEKPSEKVLFYAYSDIDKHGHDTALDDELYQNWWVVINLATVTVRIPVPMRAVIPKGLEGIVTAGRCMSIDSYASSAVRMNRDMFRMGECVGVGCAMAVKSGCGFADIDYEQFKSRVEEYGCYRGDTSKNFGFDTQNHVMPYKPVKFTLTREELRAYLASDCPGVGIWACFRHGNDTTAEWLVEWMGDTQTEHLANNAAIALGIMGRQECLEKLRAMVRERSCFYYLDCRRSNQFRSVMAICLLGRLGGREDLELLQEIVFDDKEFEREMYHTLKPAYIYCSLENCNYVLFQHLTHAAMAMVKIAEREGIDLSADFEARFTGESRRRILSEMTTLPETSAFFGEASDFMAHILSITKKDC